MKWFELGKSLAGRAAGEAAKEAGLRVLLLSLGLVALGILLAVGCGIPLIAACAGSLIPIIGMLLLGLGFVVLVLGLLIYYVGGALPRALENATLPPVPVKMDRESVASISPELAAGHPPDPDGTVQVDLFALGDKVIDNALGSAVKLVAGVSPFQAPPSPPPQPPPRYARVAGEAEATPLPPTAAREEKKEQGSPDDQKA